MKKLAILLFVLFFTCNNSYSQGCCSGGSGSPIAGGASQGVLLDRQMEVATNYQYINSDKFKSGDKDTAKIFDNFNSKYIYSKIAYGVTKDLTISIEGGYFLKKSQYGLDHIDTNISKGIADLIIFPRYDVLNRTTETKRVEITLGLGYKIPLGKHNDSVLVFHTATNYVYATMPPLVQPTNGSQDIIFYSFFFRGFPQHNFRLFANTLYIKKGWNSLGEKFGDYKSIGLFAGKTFFEKLNVTLQLKGEMIGKLKAANGIDLVALYGVDPAATGNKKIMFVPQVSYSFKSLTFFALTELPLYEYVNGVQVVSQTQFTMGLSYRFFTARTILKKDGSTVYICPMKCEGSESNEPGKCKVCGMEKIEKK